MTTLTLVESLFPDISRLKDLPLDQRAQRLIDYFRVASPTSEYAAAYFNAAHPAHAQLVQEMALLYWIAEGNIAKLEAGEDIDFHPVLEPGGRVAYEDQRGDVNKYVDLEGDADDAATVDDHGFTVEELKGNREFMEMYSDGSNEDHEDAVAAMAVAYAREESEGE